MTTIVAMHTPGVGTLIGSDSQVTDSNRKINIQGGKWIVSEDGRWGIGVSGSFRTIVLAREHANKIFDGVKTPFDVSRQIMAMLEADGYTFEGEGGPRCINGDFLIASPDGVWDVDGTFSHSEVPLDEIASCGSGAMYALGAGMALHDIVDPIVRVTRCLEIASSFDPFTGGPIWLKTLTPSLIGKKTKKRLVK